MSGWYKGSYPNFKIVVSSVALHKRVTLRLQTYTHKQARARRHTHTQARASTQRDFLGKIGLYDEYFTCYIFYMLHILTLPQ
jgi:hypothetical protein